MSEQGFWLQHYQMIQAPAWFSIIEWLVLIGFMVLATIWVLQRSRTRR